MMKTSKGLMMFNRRNSFPSREGRTCENGARDGVAMDMTPMVDVTFLLLIFFMITASFGLQKAIAFPSPHLETGSPSALRPEPEEDPRYVIVSIDRYNSYHMQTPTAEAEAPSEHDLLIELRRARRAAAGEAAPTRLLIYAHAEALHEKVVRVISMGSEVGMEQVQLKTVESE